MAKAKAPFTVSIDGSPRKVVYSDTKMWVEELANGRRLVHCGKLLRKLDPPLQVVRKSKLCGKCKKPTWTLTSRGRAMHIGCEGYLTTLPDDVAGALLFEVASQLGAEFE